jgi:hypothetical protein
MNIVRNHCTIALLRPADTSAHAYFQNERSEDSFNTYIHEWIQSYREEMSDIADDLGITLIIHEHQLFDELQIPGRKRRRTIAENSDVLTTIDPPELLLAYMQASIYNHPHMRAVLAYSSRDNFEKSFKIIGAMQQSSCIPKIFAFLYHNKDTMKDSIERALVFHNRETTSNSSE